MFARWGLSLNYAMITFLIKSIEAGGLPFDLHQHRLPTIPSRQSPASRNWMWRAWLFFQRTWMTAMVTNATNKLSLDHDHLIREWGAAGLDKPSITRIDRIAETPPGYLGTAGRIGRLAEVDIEAVKAILLEIVR